MVTVLPKASPIVLTGESFMSAWMTKRFIVAARLREITDGLLDNYGPGHGCLPCCSAARLYISAYRRNCGIKDGSSFLRKIPSVPTSLRHFAP